MSSPRPSAARGRGSRGRARLSWTPSLGPAVLAGDDIELDPHLALPRAERPQPQRVELDEAGGVAVIIGDGPLLEGDEVLAVERVRALAPDQVDAALVELQAHAAGDRLLALVDQRLQHLALGREPEAIVDELCIS